MGVISDQIEWLGIGALGMGIACGATEFIWKSVAQKVGMVVMGLENKPKLDPSDGPQILSFEILDKEFFRGVVEAPILEESIFRGLVQPALAYGITFAFPVLSAPVLLGISTASLLSIVVVSGVFGLCHYSNYEQGGAFPSAMGVVAGLVFGVVRVKLGLIAAIGAHMTSNLGTGLLDKYLPEFLEFPWERELRLLPPRERQLRLLKEAVDRVEVAVAKMSPEEIETEKPLLEQLSREWLQQIQILEGSK